MLTSSTLPHDLLVLQADHALRRDLFGDASLRHPAKQNLYQLIHLLKRFATADGFLLDPFGGSGSAMLACSSMHGPMHVMTVDLSPTFVAMQVAAWQHFLCSLEMSCGSVGTYLPVLGDSRCLLEIFASLAEHPRLSYHAFADLIITSPSYGGSEAVDQRRRQNATIAAHGGGNVAREAYVDLVVTSPPYSNSLSGESGAAQQHARRLRDSGLASMREVWNNCAQVLKPGGVLCCITRDYVRAGKRIPLGEMNRDLLIAAGLEYLEVETWHIPTLSFWRNLQHRRNPEAPVINTEQVWIFRKAV